MSPDEVVAVQELLDAEEANRMEGQTMEHQARLARARREVEDLLPKEPATR